MRRTLLITGTLILLVVTAALAGQRARSDARSREAAPGRVPWEYLVVGGGNVNLSTIGNEQYGSMRKQPEGAFSRESFPLERNLDKLGAEGWELVAVTGPPQDPIFYLKRPRGTK
jgi:hypothetical protein